MLSTPLRTGRPRGYAAIGREIGGIAARRNLTETEANHCGVLVNIWGRRLEELLLMEEDINGTCLGVIAFLSTVKHEELVY